MFYLTTTTGPKTMKTTRFPKLAVAKSEAKAFIEQNPKSVVTVHQGVGHKSKLRFAYADGTTAIDE